MRRTQVKRTLFSLLIALLLTLSTLSAALADNDYDIEYVGQGQNGFAVGSYLTTLFQLEDANDQISLAYCVDQSTYIQDHSMYKRTNLGDAGYFSSAAADKIRAVIQNAYPYITIGELRTRSGIAGLSETEAITGIQLAIWHLANGYSHSHGNHDVAALYQWLLALPPLAASSTPVGDIEIIPSYEQRPDGIRATFQYKITGQNVNGTAIAGAYTLSKNVVSAYGATVDESANGGYRVVTISGLPADAAFSFTVTATQNVGFDGYFYSPRGGREASQSLVGAFSGDTLLNKTVQFSYETPGGFTLKIRKVDSLITTVGLPGAVFEVANTDAFNDTVYEITTDTDGLATIGGLTQGTWYVREKTAPAGYIPYEGVFPVEVYQYTREQVYKNTAYGGIEILKADDAQNPVAGATFSIYKGGAVDPDKLLFEGLVTSDSGQILKGGIVPGTYTVLETAVPAGYHLNDTPVTIQVEPGQKAVVSIVNTRVQRCTLNLFKRDADTTEQLAGAVLGVYTDDTFATKLCEVVSLKNDPICVTDLLPGTYYIKELAPPDGYYNDADPQTVTLIEGQTMPVTFYNHYIPKTAGNYGLLFLLGGGSLTLCGAVLFIFRKRLFGSADTDA